MLEVAPRKVKVTFHVNSIEHKKLKKAAKDKTLSLAGYIRSQLLGK